MHQAHPPNLSVNKALSRATKHERKGNSDEARRLYREVLQAFPNNRRALERLAKLNQLSSATGLNPPQDAINRLVALYNQRQLKVVAEHAAKLIQQFPSAFILWNLLGAAHSGLGRTAEAEAGFRGAIKLAPNYPDAQNNLGLILQQQDKVDEAISAFQKAIELNPSYPDALNNLGVTLHEKGDFEEAIAAFNRALSIKPDYVNAHNNLGLSLTKDGRYDDAIKAYGKAIYLKPDYAEAYNNVGNALSDQDMHEDAIKAYNKAIALKPDYAEAYNNMGLAFQAQGMLEEAITAFKKAISFKPDCADTYLKIGTTLRYQGKLEDAITAFNKVLSLSPNCIQAYNSMGVALLDQGKLEEAVVAFNKTLSIKPGYFEAYNYIGSALIDQGKYEEAILAFYKALSLKPDHTIAHRHISALRKYTDKDPQIEQMNKLYDDPTLSEDSLCHLCFALAKVSEDLGNLNEAFQYLKQGNALRKKLLSYDILQDEELFARIKISAEEVQKHALVIPQVSNSVSPLFILGMPRSGTTLVEQIISSHSQVFGGGELEHLRAFGSQIAEGNIKASTDALTKLRDTYLEKLVGISSGKPFVTDKLPHNFKLIGLIFSTFPEAKIVHVKRSAAATCWSNYKHYFSVDGLGYCYDLQDLVRHYQLYENLMEFWDQIYAERIYHLDYDLLTIDQETETKRLLKFLALDWEHACLSPHNNKRIVRTVSHEQIRQKVYTGSSEQWRKFKPFLGGAFDELET